MKFTNIRMGITHDVLPFETTRIELLKELGFVEVVEDPAPEEEPVDNSVKPIDDKGPLKGHEGTKSTSTPANTVQGPQRASNTPKSAHTTKPTPKKS